MFCQKLGKRNTGTGELVREVEEIRNGSSNEKGRKILEETTIQRKTNASVMGQ